jgi:hypothetical protein
VPGYAWLINFEVSSQIVDLDHAKIAFVYDTSMRYCVLRQECRKNTKIQAMAGYAGHNHATILTTLTISSKL